MHCYRMLGSLDESEDLVQETFLRAWKELGRFEGRSTLSVGGAGFASTLIELGLVDEYRLFINPIVLGGGTPYFPCRSRGPNSS